LDVVRKVIEFIQGKGKALEKAMMAPSGQVDQVGWKQEVQSRLCFKAF
jgi:hypothetical protein